MIASHIRKTTIHELSKMTAGEIHTLYYLAYLDMEEQLKKKEEEEKGKQRKKAKRENEEALRRANSARGIRTGAKLRQKVDPEDAYEYPSGFNLGGSFEDLIDELEDE